MRVSVRVMHSNRRFKFFASEFVSLLFFAASFFPFFSLLPQIGAS